MNTHASIGTPVFCTTSAIGWMSTIMVRAAQLALMRSLWSAISRQSRSTASRCLGPAPGNPTSAVSIPRLSMRWRILTLTSVGGSVTEGLWRPSRRVSSSSMTVRGGDSSVPPAVAQS
jgi:hypothetical protein